MLVDLFSSSASYDQRTESWAFLQGNKGNDDGGDNKLTPALSKCGYWFLLPNVRQHIYLHFNTYLWQPGLNTLSWANSTACNVEKALHTPSKRRNSFSKRVFTCRETAISCYCITSYALCIHWILSLQIPFYGGCWRRPFFCTVCFGRAQLQFTIIAFPVLTEFVLYLNR